MLKTRRFKMLRIRGIKTLRISCVSQDSGSIKMLSWLSRYHF
jgi:hypothetical protein